MVEIIVGILAFVGFWVVLDLVGRTVTTIRFIRHRKEETIRRTAVEAERERCAKEEKKFVDFINSDEYVSFRAKTAVEAERERCAKEQKKANNFIKSGGFISFEAKTQPPLVQPTQAAPRSWKLDELMTQQMELEQLTTLRLISELTDVMGVHPIYGKLWTFNLDNQWSFWENGMKTDEVINGTTVEPMGVYVEFNGFPAGIFTCGGILVPGEAWNEATFRAALIEKILSVSMGS